MRSVRWGLLLVWVLARVHAEPPTFSEDIAPLLKRKCVACHHADGLAPFPLTTYEEVRARAGKIARIVLDGLMPPWLPSHGGFANDRRVDGKEVALLRQWVEAGAPEGDRVEAPPPPVQEWQLGVPDKVFAMASPHVVPADGRLQTVHFVFPLRLNGDRHLRAVEVMPGNRHVILQANVLFDRSGRARELAGERGWYERFGGSGFVPTGMIAAYFPGSPAAPFDERITMTLSSDTDVVLQIRYRPSGTQELDFTRVGLYFAKEPGRRTPSGVRLGNENMRIPPGTNEHVVRDEITLAAPLEVREVRPNLLLFGRSVQAWAIRPDGKRVPLLDIPDWNFTWQETYRFAQPLALPKGTRIRSEWTITNDSPRELRVGDNPEDEAPGLWIGGVAESWADHGAHTAENLRHLTKLMEAAREKR